MRKITLLVALLVIASGCISPEVAELSAVEVREYEGEHLSSITEFRENSIKGPQYIDAASYRMEIAGLVENPKTLTYNEVLANPKYSKLVTLYCVEGWNAKILWEGVLVNDLLGDVKPEANTVIFHAHDGYSTSLPLDYTLDNDIILAYKMNGVVLPPERGFPFQLVAEDKWGYKWIKWVTKIELSDDPDYMGFWETRGYSITGNLKESMFE